MRCTKLASSIGILSSLWVITKAQNNYFITPPTPGADHQYDDNNAYVLGSTINLEWKTNYSTISLVLWQNDNNSYIYLFDTVPASQSLRWAVNLDGQFNVTSTKLATPNVFFFQIWEMVDNNDTIGNRFSSHYFNITGDHSSSSTISQSSSGPATSSSVGAATTGSAMQATETPANASSSLSSGLSSGAKAGTGVGVGVGVLCLLMAASIAFFVWKNHKRSITGYQQPGERQHKEEQATPLYLGDYTPIWQKGAPDHGDNRQAKSQLLPRSRPSELSAEAPTHELSSTQAESHELP